MTNRLFNFYHRDFDKLQALGNLFYCERFVPLIALKNDFATRISAIPVFSTLALKSKTFDLNHPRNCAN